MAKPIEIRDIPDALLRRLESLAALEEVSLPDYLLTQLRRIAEQPTIAEMTERLKKHAPTDPRPSAEEAVCAERDSR
jgi:hypothetical protein